MNILRHYRLKIREMLILPFLVELKIKVLEPKILDSRRVNFPKHWQQVSKTLIPAPLALIEPDLGCT